MPFLDPPSDKSSAKEGRRQAPADLEVVIVNWNGREIIGECLGSVFAREPECSVEVSVVDNASTDDSVAFIEEHFGKRLCLYRASENGGFARGNNIALRETTARHVLLLNSDALLPSEGTNVLDAIAREFDTAPEIGVIGPRVRRPDGAFEESTGDTVSFTSLLKNNLVRLLRLPPSFAGRFSKTHWTYDRRREVDWVTGAAIAVRGEIIRAGCLLDEGYFMYTEDVEWCHRIRERGWRVVFEPAIEVLHFGQGSAPSAQSVRERKRLHREGLLRFTELHPSPGRRLVRGILRLSMLFL